MIKRHGTATIREWEEKDYLEKCLVAINSAQFFLDRQARADFKAFDRLMKRKGGEPPQPGDELPES